MAHFAVLTNSLFNIVVNDAQHNCFGSAKKGCNRRFPVVHPSIKRCTVCMGVFVNASVSACMHALVCVCVC